VLQPFGAGEAALLAWAVNNAAQPPLPVRRQPPETPE
jgi:hypothetical protein